VLHDSIQYLRGVGPKKLLAYQKLNISTVEDLLGHFPRSYEDRTRILPIDQVPLGEPCGFVASVAGPVRLTRISGGRQMCKVLLADESGAVEATFFNQPYLKTSLRPGERYLFFGRMGGSLLRREIVSPQWQRLEEGVPTPAGEILPVYPCCEGLTQKEIRRHVAQALEQNGDQLEEYLPSQLVHSHSLLSYPEAIRAIHHPASFAQLEQARQRLCFDELLILSTAMLRLKGRRQALRNQRVVPMADLKPFTDALPYQLTGAQQRAIEEVLADMAGPVPMNRLVQGDVGCGKTMVAFAALYAAARGGWQSALMAPTEILARQHYDNLCRLAPALHLRVGLLTGSMTRRQKQQIKAQAAAGELDVLIGTHALLQQDVHFARLTLVVTDEQHRFGVDQRSALADKGGVPHMLVMSATPIPRSLAFVLYGDLDLSVIDELPPGRQPVETHLVAENRREGLYGFIRQEARQGRQTFFICPLVEESEKMDLQAATTFAAQLQQEVFPDLRVGCIHGRMKQAEKGLIMEQFAAGALDILVSTTVIEVGIDIPNATVLVVEDAGRFGLSQLHQLRGRVGRGSHRSWCFLMGRQLSETGRKRLQLLCSSHDGFVIAQEDLRLRGPGDFFGNRQHGLPQLKIADLFGDSRTIALARECAQQLLDADPALEQPQHHGLRKRCARLLAAIQRANTFN
jgi:ATP-dependent DNA helicase RecG